MNNERIASQFDELADLLEIQGANPFRIRAYRNASRTLEGITDSVSSLLEEGTDLTELSGIGKDLAAKIAELVESGTLEQLEELKAEVPPGVLDIMRLPGVGPKKAATLFKELNITNLDELKAAAQAGEIQNLKGFAKKTEDSILANIDQAAKSKERTFFATAEPLVEQIVETLAALASTQQVTPAGSFRRRKETVGDLDILVTSDDVDEVMDALANHDLVEEVLQRGETKQRVRLIKGLEMDLHSRSGEVVRSRNAIFYWF